jgi:hypothetical protein
MPMMKIDGQEYDVDSFSQEAKAQLLSIQFIDKELVRLQMQVAALQTARNAYAMGLKSVMPSLALDKPVE